MQTSKVPTQLCALMFLSILRMEKAFQTTLVNVFFEGVFYAINTLLTKI